MGLVAHALEHLEVGPPQAHGNLVMFPLLGDDQPALEYTTLDLALAQGLGRITEVNEAGDVNHLLFENFWACPILLLDGEELVGQKQNRITNLTVLVPGHGSTVIPVSCVEKGRWGYQYGGQHEGFSTSTTTHFARGRALKMESVTLSLAHDSRVGDQEAVWASVDAKMDELAVASTSSSCTEISRVYDDELTGHIDALRLLPRQRGAIFSVADDLTGLELFDRSSTLKLLMPKLIRSYAMDSLSRQDNPARRMSMALARRFLGEVAGAGLRSHRAVGHGQDIRLISESVSGGGLSCDGVVIQLSAFRKSQQPPTRDFASTIPQVAQAGRGRSPFPDWEDES